MSTIPVIARAHGNTTQPDSYPDAGELIFGSNSSPAYPMPIYKIGLGSGHMDPSFAVMEDGVQFVRHKLPVLFVAKAEAAGPSPNDYYCWSTLLKGLSVMPEVPEYTVLTLRVYSPNQAGEVNLIINNELQKPIRDRDGGYLNAGDLVPNRLQDIVFFNNVWRLR